ncbi:unnamed protein product [Diatraea saccharalis]|uniref:Uncharacterized protein n=1 Tax=Diatraea saccharalis TaxID=40085 RepID=A0A9N9QVS1_9NEOP|nr:unnamed protein product [Diatraea saccharalis]
MIWPNHDFYSGEWKNGVMSGYGMYIWDTYYNNSLSLPSLCAYRGTWLKGQRNGYGVLNLGLGMGSYYKGEFKNNKKHGVGRFVSNNGLILQNKNIFIDDNFGPMLSDEYLCCPRDSKLNAINEPYKFDICDTSEGYLYHVQEAIKNIDKQAEVRRNMISDYIENNKLTDIDLYMAMRKEETKNQTKLSNDIDFDDLINFEESSLRKSLRCYEIDLKNIYYNYATICNTEEIQFTPVLIRLFLWQFYYDCNIHENGLTLVDIDKMFHRNPEWLSKSSHNPFEKIYYWQFLHSLISVASRLYAKRELPGPKPDTILANGFRKFMERDILPNIGRRRGRLIEYGKFVPLKGLYALYRNLGEPHTVRDFLCAVRRPPHDMDKPQSPLVDAPDGSLPLGKNTYVIGDNMVFIANDEELRLVEFEENYSEEPPKDLRLFNFGNLSSKIIIKIFSNIFPHLSSANAIMNLDIRITFFEFFEAFIACAQESIRVKDEEIRRAEKLSGCYRTTRPTLATKAK